MRAHAVREPRRYYCTEYGKWLSLAIVEVAAVPSRAEPGVPIRGSAEAA
jgi:hypothetical protein